MENKPMHPLVGAGLILLLMLGVLYAFGLPPRQTADAVGLVWCVAVHCGTTGGLLWLWNPPQTPLLRLGGTVTLALWWLVAELVVLGFRLFSISAVGLLLTVQSVLALAAALLTLVFYCCRRYGE